MDLGRGPAFGARFRRPAAALTAGILLAAAGYQAPASFVVDLGRGLPSALVTEGFHDAEASYRWTRARSTLVFPDPGAGEVRLELVLSGFRPPGSDAPLLSIEAGGERLRLRPSRRIASYELETASAGLWSSSLEVSLRADTFTPGSGDDRALGVRLHEARLDVGAGSVPPLRQLLAAGVLSFLAFVGVASRERPASRAAQIAALGIAPAVGAGYALFRLETALAVPALAAAASLAALARWLVPFAADFLADAARRSARSAAGADARERLLPAILSVAAVAVAATVAATLATPRVELDIGSGGLGPISTGFLGADRDAEGVRFRRALPGASLDLRDFGWGRPWRVAIEARLASGGQARAVLARLGSREIAAELDEEWSLEGLVVPPEGPGFRGGHLVIFPGMGPGTELDVASVAIDRGRGLPSLRLLFLVVVSSSLLLLAMRIAGLRLRHAGAVAVSATVLLAAGLAAEPGIAIPFVSTVALAAGAAALVASAARGVAGALAERDVVPELHPAALAVSVVGFGLWFLTSASPLYEGGHFRYHSSVADEIWRGNFLLYYLPGPENMLARQPQWGSLVVPHPCLYHTVASPFAALPSPWFALGTKLFLAALLFEIALVGALVATELGGRRAGGLAALLVVLSPIGYQLLGLGHLMTLFGCWAAALALGFLVLHVDRLRERKWRRWALALLTLCFVSYTGSLLFTSMALLLSTALVLRDAPRLAGRLAALLLLGWVAALSLYYAYWVPPFLTETLPVLLSGTVSGESLDLGARLAAVPRKLDYTFGSVLFPLAGLFGVALAPRGHARSLLASWASVLVLVSVLDLLFNFLLKHHYFTFPAVSVGLALVSDRLSREKLGGRVALAAVVVYLGWVGVDEALWAALGLG